MSGIGLIPAASAGAVTSVAGRTGAVVIGESDVTFSDDAVAATASRRTLGYTGNKAMPGVARLDQVAAAGADVSFGGYKATLLARPTAATDAAPLGINLDAYTMKQRGLVAENYPAASATNSAAAVSQSLYQFKVWLPYTVSVTGIVLAVTAAGSSLTSGQCVASLYASDGTLKGSTSDQSAVWTSIGTYAMAVGGGPYSMTGGDGAYCWVTVFANGTTPPSFAAAGNRQVMNAGSGGALSGANLLAGRNGTAITAAPSPLVPGNAVITLAVTAWAGLY